MKNLESNISIFRLIERKDRLAETVIEQISQAILEGKLHPGDKLVEEQIGGQLGVSRAPVRDAFQQLEQFGLVEKIPYKGTFVSRLSEREIIELHSIRAALECLAGEILANRRNSEDIKFLTQIIEKMQEVAKKGDRGEILVLDADFHDALINLSDNHVLIETWQPIRIKMRRFLLLKRHHTHNTIQEVIAPHKMIVDAIDSGNSDKAISAIKSHLKRVEEKFMENIHKGKSLFYEDTR